MEAKRQALDPGPASPRLTHLCPVSTWGCTPSGMKKLSLNLPSRGPPMKLSTRKPGTPDE